MTSGQMKASLGCAPSKITSPTTSPPGNGSFIGRPPNNPITIPRQLTKNQTSTACQRSTVRHSQLKTNAPRDHHFVAAQPINRYNKNKSMRMIGTIENETHARLFSDYLYVLGIENQVEEDEPPAWVLWIHSDEQIDKASGLLAQFKADPQNPRYRQGAKSAEDRRALAEQAELAARRRMIDGRQALVRQGSFGMGPLTLLFIGVCVAVSLISNFGDRASLISSLFIASSYNLNASMFERLLSLREIGQGQVWRVFTPIFIHYGFIHLLFNMLWLKDLGTAIERRESTGTLAVMILTIAGISNLAQFLSQGPNFGGMSGVVYGLLGYIWIRGKHDPSSGYHVPPPTVVFMGVWFLVCAFGWISNVANVVHGVGLAIGIAWGYRAAKHS